MGGGGGGSEGLVTLLLDLPSANKRQSVIITNETPRKGRHLISGGV